MKSKIHFKKMLTVLTLLAVAVPTSLNVVACRPTTQKSEVQDDKIFQAIQKITFIFKTQVDFKEDISRVVLGVLIDENLAYNQNDFKFELISQNNQEQIAVSFKKYDVVYVTYRELSFPSLPVPPILPEWPSVSSKYVGKQIYNTYGSTKYSDLKELTVKNLAEVLIEQLNKKLGNIFDEKLFKITQLLVGIADPKEVTNEDLKQKKPFAFAIYFTYDTFNGRYLGRISTF